MLSLFPQLFDFAFPATAILRFVIAIVFIIEGKRSFSKKPILPIVIAPLISYAKKTQAVLEMIGGLLLFIGLFTQAISLVLALSTLVRLYTEYRSKPCDKRIYSFYVLLFFFTLSFLFLSPGMLSLDYPL